MNQSQIKLSKFLSYVLRHHPQKIGIQLDSAGWVSVDELISQASTHGRRFTREQLDEVVRLNPKKRFKFNEDGTQIRASQGHSVKVNLEYQPKNPPETLYHGTATKYLDSIQEKGLLPRNRHHVHLSADLQTASAVGSRHGKLVILLIQAEKMKQDGYIFYQSDNGVWLTENVPPVYFSILDAD